MEEDNNNNSIDEDSLMTICYLWYMQVKQWEDFEFEIKNKNRYFPNNTILNEIKKIHNYAIFNLLPGDSFYRARLYHLNWEFCKDEINDLLKKYFPNFAKSNENLDISKLSDQIKFSIGLLKVNLNDSNFAKEFDLVFNGKKFYGYNAKDSDAPPNNLATANRANPEHISYLYVAEDVKTAIMEVRPNHLQQVSVATVKILEPLKLFDFCYNETEKSLGENFNLDIIAAAFSTPNFGNKDNYYATQYICEYIKNLGFDGIRFQSSLNPDGKNIVIFNTNEIFEKDHKNYEVVESRVYNTTKIDLDYEMIAPTPTEELNSK